MRASRELGPLRPLALHSGRGCSTKGAANPAWVDSQLGQTGGSGFFLQELREVTLSTPLHGEGKSGGPASRQHELDDHPCILMPSNLSCPRVLLVEDSEDDAFFFRWTLEKCGLPCDVVHTVDGIAAMQHLEAVLAGRAPHPDLVFLDLKIPSFTGFEVLAWVRERNFEPPLDVAVLSGSEHASDIQRAHALGATGYYVKPLSVEQLRTRINEWRASRGGVEDRTHSEAHGCGHRNVTA
jgi:CheY-like chemotaxis protein